MQSKKFTRTIEDFTCEHCGRRVIGNGYTNHCPYCLWSKHVDVNPGDRQGTCGGMMEPVAGEKQGKEYVLSHVCKRCGFMKINRLVATDDFDAFLAIARNAAAKGSQ